MIIKASILALKCVFSHCLYPLLVLKLMLMGVTVIRSQRGGTIKVICVGFGWTFLSLACTNA